MAHHNGYDSPCCPERHRTCQQQTLKVQEAAAVRKVHFQNGTAAADRVPHGPNGLTGSLAGPAIAAVDGSGTYPSRAAREALFGTGPEQAQEVEAKVTGIIPDWLTGSLVMNGGVDYAPMKHLFDGYGMLSKVRMEGDRAWGSQRYINTKAYRLYKKQGCVVLNEFATPPQGLTAYLQQMAAPFAAMLFGTRQFTPATDNACVSVYTVGPGASAADDRQRRIYNTADGGLTDTTKQAVYLNALTEDPFGSYIVDPVTLETIQQVDYPDRLPALMQTAHPAVMADGSFVNISRTFAFGGSHVFGQDRVTHKRTEVTDTKLKCLHLAVSADCQVGWCQSILSLAYAYCTCAVRPTNIGNGLSKLDLHTGAVKVWHHPGGVTGEPHFIPNPETKAEDDGVVVSSCVDDSGKAFLLLLDASSWTEIARAKLPYPTLYRFHGVWLPQ